MRQAGQCEAHRQGRPHSFRWHLSAMGFISVGHKINLKRRRTNPSWPSYASLQRLRANTVAIISGPPRHMPRLGISTPPRQVKLTDLPAEVLLLIFCLAGVGQNNMLPLTCRFLNRLLSPSKNRWVVDWVVETNFTADLNEGIDGARWQLKLQHSVSLLPDSYKNTSIMDRLYNLPMAVAQGGRAIDVRIFDFAFVDAETVRLIHKNYGGIVADSRSIGHQQKYRASYLEWRLLVLDKFVRMANEPERAMAPTLQESAEDLMAGAELAMSEFGQKHDLTEFSPQTRSRPQSFDGNENMSLKTLRKVLSIHRLYEAKIINASNLLLAAFKCNEVVDAETYSELTILLPLDCLSSRDILNLLKVFEICQKRICSVQPDQRTSHPLQAVIEPLYDLVRQSLSSPYRIELHEDSESIWQALQRIQIPELLDHVIKRAGAISLELI